MNETIILSGLIVGLGIASYVYIHFLKKKIKELEGEASGLIKEISALQKSNIVCLKSNDKYIETLAKISTSKSIEEVKVVINNLLIGEINQ